MGAQSGHGLPFLSGKQICLEKILITIAVGLNATADGGWVCWRGVWSKPRDAVWRSTFLSQVTLPRNKTSHQPHQAVR